MITEPAPILIFCYNRPAHLSRLLASLGKNTLFLKSPLFIFCDGEKNELDRPRVEAVRKIIAAISHGNMHATYRTTNVGLARSLVSGVSTVLLDYDRVIVLEDDLEVNPVFLSYMNEALNYYRDSVEVMQISGYQYPIGSGAQSDACVFFPFTTSWGWGTWREAWENYEHLPNLATFDSRERRMFDQNAASPSSRMLLRALQGYTNSWAIRWYYAVFRRRGLVLFPPRSLVFNGGLDGSGTHGSGSAVARIQGFSERPVSFRFPEVLSVDTSAYLQALSYLRKANYSLRARGARLFRDVLELRFLRW